MFEQRPARCAPLRRLARCLLFGGRGGIGAFCAELAAFCFARRLAFATGFDDAFPRLVEAVELGLVVQLVATLQRLLALRIRLRDFTGCGERRAVREK